MALSITVTVAVSLALALVLTRLMIAFAPRIGLVDHPDERRVHAAPVPRAGGMALWMTFLAGGAIVLACFPGAGVFDWDWFRAFAFASAILVAVGVIDDRTGISPWIKLAAQVGVGGLLFFAKGSGVGTIFGVAVPWFVDLGIWIIWTVGIINAFNLIDGIDGLCAGLATISIGALAVLSFILGRTVDGLIMLAMMAGLIGFLRYNFHPAKIFLGDAGSMFIGLFIASAATVSAGERAVAAAILIPLLVAGVPLFDVLLAVWRRTARTWLSELGVGRAARVFGADKEHLHHRLLDAGLTQRKVAGLLYAVALFGAIIALLPSIFDERAIGITVAAVLIAGLLGFRYLAPVELHTSGAVLDLVLQRPPAGRLIALTYFTYDALVIMMALAFALLVEYNGRFTWLGGHPHLFNLFAITLACGLVGLRMAKAHSRKWGRASIRDFWALILWFSVSMQVAFTLMTLVSHDVAWETVRIFILTGTIALVLFALPRSLTPLIREAVIDSHHRRLGRSTGQRKRLVLYGAGDLGELFLSHLKTTRPAQLDEMRILGYIDDHPNMKGRFLDGFRIYGSVDALPYLKQRLNLHGVVITTTRLEPEQAHRLNRLADEYGLTLYRWRPHLQFAKIGGDQILDEGDDTENQTGTTS